VQVFIDGRPAYLQGSILSEYLKKRERIAQGRGRFQNLSLKPRRRTGGKVLKDKFAIEILRDPCLCP